MKLRRPVQPQVISHYSILKKLGEGGMGEVYLAEDLTLHRKVVLKRLSSRIASDERSKRRLIREAQSASALDHPNICTIYEVGQDNGESFIAMQYVEGQILSTYARTRKVGISETVDIFSQIASALAESHRKGIIHRDIKPANIIINQQGLVKVVDFGLATRKPVATQSMGEVETQSLPSDPKAIIGTVPYMSPEQACAEELDPSSDVFSLGTVIYELSAGQHPFARKSFGETLSAILTTTPPPLSGLRPDVPPGFDRIITRCLDKDKRKRFQNGAELIAELTALKREMDAGRIAPSKRTISTRRTIFVAGVLLLITLAASFIFYQGRWRRKVIAKPLEIHSLAVLPFNDDGSNESIAYLSDGLTDSLINSLAELSEVKVVARNSVFRYKGKDFDPESVGRELKVQALLTGKIAQQAEGVRLSVELVDARDNAHVWGAIYTFKDSDALKIQDSIAREIAERLRLGLQEPQQQNSPKSYTENHEAYQMYLRGRFFWNKRTANDLLKGIEFFQQAIALDPRYALAYAGLADSYVLLGSVGYDVIPPKEAMSKAEDAVAKALQIDGELAEAHNSAAIIKLQYTWEWEQADREFQRAIQLKPNLSVAHYWYSLYLMGMGRRDESIVESRKAQELDPLALIVGVNIARAYYLGRQYDLAINECRKVIELDDQFIWAHYFLGLCYIQKGMYAEAVAAFQKCMALSSRQGAFHSALAYTYAVSNQKAKARRILRMLEQTSTKAVAPSDLAIIYTGLGEKGRALQFLEKACDEHSSVMFGLNVEPMYDSLRSEPGFTAILSRLGLPKK